MEIKVVKTYYAKDFREKLNKALSKGASAIVNLVDKKIYISSYANNRVTGRFIFEKQRTSYVLISKQEIESEFYPLEIAIDTLVKYLKGSKIKTIKYVV